MHHSLRHIMLTIHSLFYLYHHMLFFFFFFFSSRRRHTRLQGDWSSDVCSSDLDPPRPNPPGRPHRSPGPTPGGSRSSIPGRWRSRSARDRKSTRLNSSHLVISYAVFCLKKKKKEVNERLEAAQTVQIQ